MREMKSTQSKLILLTAGILALLSVMASNIRVTNAPRIEAEYESSRLSAAETDEAGETETPTEGEEAGPDINASTAKSSAANPSAPVTAQPKPEAPPAAQPPAPSTTKPANPPATAPPATTKPSVAVQPPAATKPPAPPAAQPKPETPTSPPAPADPASKLRALKEKNSDAIGWLILDGTQINFPVMQTTDNEYYLGHDEYKNKTSNGAVYLDYQMNSDFTSANNLIYAHNLSAEGKGFSEIVNYKNKSFFDANTTGELYTGDKTFRLEIFAVYYRSAYVESYYRWYPASADAFEGYLEEIKTNAMYYREKNLRWGDRIVTFSTCSYEFADARTILHAKLVEI